MAAVRGCSTAAIAYGCGMQGLYDRIVLGCFVACGVSRLACYNVTAEKLSEAAARSHFEGTPIPTSVVLVGVLAAAAWQSALGERLWFGVIDIAGFHLHPLVLLFALSGSLMMSRIRIPEAARVEEAAGCLAPPRLARWHLANTDKRGNGMAFGWLTVLKLVPWGEVIKNAPAVADGARKLWDSVGRKPPPAGDAAPPTLAADAPPHAVLQARLAEAEASIAALHEQMQASSTLIKALAEQNTELIRRVETNRVRVLWLAVGVLLFGAIAALNLAVTFSR